MTMSLVNYTSLNEYSDLHYSALFQTNMPYASVQELNGIFTNPIIPKTEVFDEWVLRPLSDRVSSALSVLQQGAQTVDRLFTRAITFPPVVWAADVSPRKKCIPPKSMEERVEARYDKVRKSGKVLKRQVQQAICHGGKIVAFKDATGGAYLIKDENDRTIAIFKPEDEGTWRPNNSNPMYRKKELSEEDKYFHQANSFEQGKPAIRQHLAELMHLGTATTVPPGIVMELSSDQFFSLEAQEKGEKAPVQTKRGYLQKWVPNHQPLLVYHPSMKDCLEGQVPPVQAYDFHDNPILDRIPLDEFQEVVLNDLLLYNQDRNTGNLLVSFDADQIPHLTLIDHDTILPGKFTSLFGVYKHARMNEPFTATSLKLIEAINPDYQAAMIEKAGLFEEISSNAKAMAIVVKRFAAAGATLRDIERFVSFGDRDQFHKTSKLWKLIEEANEEAILQLPEEDRIKFRRNFSLRRADWCETVKKPWCEQLPIHQQAEAALWQKNYRKTEAQRIEKQVKANFWKEFNRRLADPKILRESCNP